MRFFFLFCAAALCADTGYFRPPDGWQLVDPKQLSPYVQVMFMGEAANNFAPTINLATEETDSTFKEYFKGVKEFHRSSPEETWRDLGKFSLQAGEGRLTEITSPSPVGEIKMLQTIFVKGKRAYVMTAAVLKADFMKYQSTILESLKSLTVVPHLFAGIKQADEKTKIETVFAALGRDTASEEQKWEEWQKLLTDSYSDMGEHWHLLALKEGWARIHEEGDKGEKEGEIEAKSGQESLIH